MFSGTIISSAVQITEELIGPRGRGEPLRRLQKLGVRS